MIKSNQIFDKEKSIKVSQQVEAEQPSVIQIPLGQGAAVLLSNEDADLTEYAWYPAVRNERLVYAACWTHKDENGKWVRQFLHRVVMERVIGRPLTHREHVDHIDNNGLNDSRENLRIVNTSQNGANRRIGPGNKSGYKGVYLNPHTQKWCASIGFQRKTIHLGTFSSPHDAARAYNAKALELQGQYAKLNVINESGEYEPPRIYRSPNPKNKRGSSGMVPTTPSSKSRNTSGYRGVSWNKWSKKWEANIKFHQKNFHLGRFADKRDAARAYNAKAWELHGEYARLNEIDEPDGGDASRKEGR